MEHSMNELIRYNYKLYTAKGLTTVSKVTETGRRGIARLHTRQCNYAINNGSFTYVDIDGEKTAWQFGCYKFYDTQEERDIAREKYKKEQESLNYRNKLISIIKDLPTDKLEEIVKSLNK